MKSPIQRVDRLGESCDSDSLVNEEERIRAAYKKRERSSVAELYDWHQQAVQLNLYRRAIVCTKMFRKVGLTNLSDTEILDVGCGNGSWLRTLQEWGATPEKLHGIDFLESRISEARKRAPHIDCRTAAGWGVEFPDASFDLVTANTVFSSILDPDARKFLANEIMRVARPGGRIVIYDFRYNNPRNSDVVGIGTAEIRRLFPGRLLKRYTLNLLPPISRMISPICPFATQGLELLFPFLRSHVVFGLSSSVEA